MVLANGSLWILAIVFLWTEKNHQQRLAALSTESLREILVRDLGEQFQKLDRSLSVAAEERRFGGTAKVFTLDGRGTAEPSPLLETEDLRRALQEGDPAPEGLRFSGPVRKKDQSGWMLVLSRRLPADRQGPPAFVYETLDLAEIQDRFRRLKLGPGGSIGLRDDRLRLLARFPDAVQTGGVGSTKIAVDFQEALRADSNRGTYVARQTSIDGVRRLHTYRRHPVYPFYVNVGMAQIDMERPWLMEMVGTLSLVFVFGVFSLVVARSLARSWTRHEADLQEIRRLNMLEEERGRDLERALVAAEAGVRSREDFLAKMSHEIRTPMNIMLGMTELGLHANPPEKQRVYLERTREAGRRLLGQIEEILDYSRMNAGHLSLDVKDFSLNALLEDLRSTMEEPAVRKGLAYRVEMDPALPASVRGDAGRIRQVLVNFLQNAVKFTDRGHVILRVQVMRDIETRSSMGGNRPVDLMFEVEDTGIGIPFEAQARIFQPFEQADNSTTRTHGGSGLGLAICRQLAESMGGSVSVTSNPGSGSVFRFRVPLSRVDGTP